MNPRTLAVAVLASAAAIATQHARAQDAEYGADTAASDRSVVPFDDTEWLSPGATGALTYSFSAVLPPARLAPQVTLSYNSLSGQDKEAPYGWALRSPVTIRRAPVRGYQSDDCLIESPRYGGVLRQLEAGGTRYQLMVNGSFTVIGDYDKNANAWTVRTSDGLKWSLRVVSGGSSLSDTPVWRASSCTDLCGNLIEFSYFDGTVSALDAGRLKEILYGGNASTGDNHLVRVTFDYDARDERYSVRGARGNVDWYREVLRQIDIACRTTDPDAVWGTVRSYYFGLGQPEDESVVLLQSIWEIGHAGGGDVWRKLAGFSYSPRNANRDNGRNNETTMPFADLGAQWVLFNAGDPRYTVVRSALLDWNGDGLLDYVGANGEGQWLVHLQTVDPATRKHGWQSTATTVEGPPEYLAYWVNTADLQVGKTVDLNGDSYPDVIRAPVDENNEPTTAWKIWFGTGSGFENARQVESPVAAIERTYTPDATSKGGVNTLTRLYSTLIDVNGDGWLDIVQMQDTPQLTVWFHSGTKDGGWSRKVTMVPPWATDLASVTGEADGKYGPGDFYNLGVHSSWAYYSGLTDLNGDGLLDYVVAGQQAGRFAAPSDHYWRAYFGNGEGWSEGHSWPAYNQTDHDTMPLFQSRGPIQERPESGDDLNNEALATTVALLDVDADGLLDLVYANFDEDSTNEPGWFRNLGSRFDDRRRSLPDWWRSRGRHEINNSIFFDHESEAKLFGIGRTKYAKWSYATYALVLDVDRDGKLDFLTTTIDRKEDQPVIFGKGPRPYLLQGITRPSGASWTVAYRSSSSVEPSGTPQQQHLSRRLDLVDSIQSKDSISGLSEESTFAYKSGRDDGGLFRGFQERWRYNQGEHPYSGNTRRWSVYEKYDQDAYLPRAMLKRIVLDDAQRRYAPSLEKASTDDYAIKVREEWTWKRKGMRRVAVAKSTSEYGEDAAATQRVRTLSMAYNDAGHLIEVNDDGAGRVENARRTTIRYADDADGIVFRPCRRTIEGPDPLTAPDGSKVKLAETRWYYDGSAIEGATLVKALPTTISVSAGWRGGAQAIDAELLTWKNTYGTRGSVISSTDPNGRTTKFGWGFGTAVPTNSTDPSGFKTEKTVDSQGRITTVTDPQHGLSLLYAYDLFGRVRSLSRRLMTASGSVVEQPLQEDAYQESVAPFWVRSKLVGDTDAVSSTEYIVLDGRGAPLQIWAQAADGHHQVTTAIRDARGNELVRFHPRQRTTTPETDWGGLDDPGDAWRVAYVDGRGQAREVFDDASWQTTSHVVTIAEPWDSSVTDPDGYTTTKTVDVLGRLTSVARGRAGTSLKLATYEYDGMNRLVRATDGGGSAYEFSYDAAGRLRTMNGPALGQRRHTYTGLDETRQEDDAGGWVTYEYDAAGRPSARLVSDPLSPDRPARYSWTYDTTWTGALCSAADPAGTTTYARDEWGRIAKIVRQSRPATPLGVEAVFKYQYDRQNRITSESWPSGVTLASGYSHGWRTSVTASVGSALSMSYDRYGRPAGWSDSGGVALDIDSDSPLHVSALTMRKGGATLAGVEYSWRPNGLLATRTDDDGTSTYGYNDTMQVGHLVESAGASSTEETLEFDAAGNPKTRTAPDGTTWNFVRGEGNRLLQASNGSSSETFHYDTAGRVSSIESPGPSGTPATLEYLYYGNGTLRAIRSGGNSVLELEYTGSGAVARRRVAGEPGKARAIHSFLNWSGTAPGANLEVLRLGSQPVALHSSGSLSFVMPDVAGRGYRVFDSAGAQVAMKRYDAYGSPVTSVGREWMELGFGGISSEVGQQLFATPNRHLLAGRGVWLQPEPVLLGGLAGSDLSEARTLNPYRYACNRPGSLVDPSGRAGDDSSWVFSVQTKTIQEVLDGPTLSVGDTVVLDSPPTIHQLAALCHKAHGYEVGLRMVRNLSTGEMRYLILQGNSGKTDWMAAIPRVNPAFPIVGPAIHTHGMIRASHWPWDKLFWSAATPSGGGGDQGYLQAASNWNPPVNTGIVLIVDPNVLSPEASLKGLTVYTADDVLFTWTNDHPDLLDVMMGAEDVDSWQPASRGEVLPGVPDIEEEEQ